MIAYLTDHKNNKYWQEIKIEECEPNAMRTVRIYKDEKRQSIRGFGGAFTESSGYNYSLLSEENRKRFIEAYFSEKGLKYNIGRVHINSCDFALGNYAYLEKSDPELNGYDISRDKKYILPLINDAGAEKLSLLASPWSPPAYMKTNGEMNHGGSLKTEYYTEWAKYMARFVKEYRALGVKIDMVTVQNEPAAVQTWDSCIYSGTDEGIFVSKYLGPEFEKEGLSDVKIFVWDHNKDIIYDRAVETLSVPGAGKYVGGIAFHWYTGDHFDAVKLVAEKFPDKELIFTEGCVEYSRFADSDETKKAEMYAHDMIGNLNAGATAIIDWNLLLDAKGGPNHVGNFCAAPVMGTEDGKDFEKRLSYYYIGHFSRFIEKDAKRLVTSSFSDKVEITSFENTSGQTVSVILNRNEEDTWFTLYDGKKAWSVTVPGHSVVTLSE